MDMPETRKTFEPCLFGNVNLNTDSSNIRSLKYEPLSFIKSALYCFVSKLVVHFCLVKRGEGVAVEEKEEGL